MMAQFFLLTIIGQDCVLLRTVSIVFNENASIYGGHPPGKAGKPGKSGN